MTDSAEVEQVVRSHFAVKDSFIMEDGSVEFRVRYDSGSRTAFRRVLASVRELGFTPHLHGTSEDASLTLVREAPPPPTYPRAPVFLFFITLASVVVTGYVLGDIYSVVFPSTSPYPMAAGFVLAVLGVLGGRELAQRYMARRNGRSTVLPYYLPNLPVFIAIPILYFLPTFGSITSMRSPAVDRDALFDFYLLGPLVGIAISFVVALFGTSTSIVLTHAQYLEIFGSGRLGTLNTNPSLLQEAALSGITWLGLSPSVPPGGVSLFSPIEIAAWLGFLLSFLSLLPAALFDGGRMATLVLGVRGSKITTAASALLLLLIDVPNYWVIFLLIFLLAAVQPSSETLDSVSTVSRSRRFLFVAALCLALLCAPVPQSIATFQL